MLTEQAQEWLKRRGVDPDIALALGVVSQQSGGGRQELEFPRIRGTEVLGRHYRRIDLDKSAENVFRQEAGSEKMCFNENALSDDRFLGQAPVLTEGEMDTLASVTAGYDRVASVPDGAPGHEVDIEADSSKWSYVPDLIDLLKNETKIILAFDDDQPGKYLRTYIAARLGKARCYFVKYPPGCKDLNDVLRRLGREAVIRCIQQAKPIRVPGVVKARDLPDVPPDVVFKTGISEDVDRCLSIVMGQLSVWTGIPGHGKSTLLDAVSIEMSRIHGIISAVASFEAEVRPHLRPAIASYTSGVPAADLSPAQWAAADSFIDDHYVFIQEDEDDYDPMTLEWLLERMEVCAIRHGARFFIIDPWASLEHARHPTESEHDYTGRALNTLKRFAKRFECHVAIVAHPTKSVMRDGKARPPTGYDISGSSHWFNLPHLGMTVYRDRDEGENCTKLIPWKIKRQPEMGVQKPAMLTISPETGTYLDWYASGGIAA